MVRGEWGTHKIKLLVYPSGSRRMEVEDQRLLEAFTEEWKKVTNMRNNPQLSTTSDGSRLGVIGSGLGVGLGQRLLAAFTEEVEESN